MANEFIERADLQIIRYSQVWEDHQTLEEGLRIESDDDVLSIGSAGCNVLALLAKAPRSLTAVDVSAAQIALLELKLAAIRTQPYEDFLVLLGNDANGESAAQRVQIYARLRDALPAYAQTFWDAHGAELREGLLHCGRLERYLANFHAALRRIHPPEVLDQWFGFSNLVEQQKYFDEHVATDAFCTAYCDWFGRQSMQERGRDPSQYRYVTVEDPGIYGLQQLRDHCGRVLLKGNPYMTYWLRGRSHMPEIIAAHRLPHFRPESYAALRELLPSVRLVVEDVAQLVRREPAFHFSKVNLSNIFEYMSEADSSALFRTLGERLRARGRFVYWNLLVERAASEKDSTRLKPQRAEAAAIKHRDRLYYYRAFHIEEAL